MPPENTPPPTPGGPRLTHLLIIAALVIGGLLLVHVLRNAARMQDCLLSGRTNCAPIEVPADSSP
jgi:hypothetical protein